MFNTTIMENIKYGDGDATEEQVYHACQVANIQSFIDSTPEKLHTRIGDKGIRYKQQILNAAKTFSCYYYESISNPIMSLITNVVFLKASYA